MIFLQSAVSGLRDNGISIIKYILSKASETLITQGFHVCAFA